jgi:hypothetical protein
MATRAAALELRTGPNRESVATYFGLTVQVLQRMQHYSLVRYRDHELVVSTEDLHDAAARQLAA